MLLRSLALVGPLLLGVASAQTTHVTPVGAQAPAGAVSAGGGSTPSGGSFGAPELTPTLAIAGLVVVVGGALLLVSRRRKPATDA